MRKEVHCTYCGTMIMSNEIYIPEKAHVGSIHITAVCENCDKPTEQKLGSNDFKVKTAIVVACMNCGSTISPDVGFCKACTTTATNTFRIDNTGVIPFGQ